MKNTIKQTILLIEDDPDICELLEYNLQREGFQVGTKQNGAEGLKFALEQTPSLIILDLMLPGMDGLEICRRLRADEKTAGVPILMLTAKSEETDKILGLGMGADDYLTKPFSPKELVARVRAILRRSEWNTTPQAKERVSVGPVSIDSSRHEAFIRGEMVDLTLSEFRMLRTLVSNAGRVMTRDQLLDEITLGENIVIDRNVDVHIGAIRKKLGQDSHLISTVRGIGYKFKD